MTTLVGIRTGKGNGRDSVILASDTAGTQTNWTPQGDVVYRTQTRVEKQKIYVDKKKRIAVSMTGLIDSAYMGFLSRLLDGNIDFHQAIQRRDFEELRDLNLSRWSRRIPDRDSMNSLLIAVRYAEPLLFSCWPLGEVERKDWTSIGSGSGYAFKYISDSGKFIPRGLNTGSGIDLAVGSLDLASQDIYTGGLDMVVVNKEGIYNIGSRIRKDVGAARTASLKAVKKKFSK